MDEPAATAQASRASLALPAEPWRAVNFSLLLPGLGHWDLGERTRGLVWAVPAIALWCAGGAFLVLPRLNAPIGIVFLIAAVVLIVLAALDAYRVAAQCNGALEEERKRQRDPWKAMFFDRLLPALGHGYARRIPSGIVWLVLWAGANSLGSPLRGFAAGLTLALVAFDVWRRGKTRRTTDRGLALVFVLAVGIWTAVSIVVPDVVRERYLRAFRIPGLSMQPTLAAGDYVFVDLRPFTPRRGEIIVHSTRLNPAERFAKRVLGVAGDVVEFGPEGAYCNGTLAVRSQVPREMLERDDYLGHPGAPYRVPDGTVFVVGDDLPNSNDSRFIGPIPNGALFGRPYKIYWPPQHARPLTRP